MSSSLIMLSRGRNKKEGAHRISQRGLEHLREKEREVEREREGGETEKQRLGKSWALL